MWKSIIQTSFAKFYVIGINLLLFPILTRYLGTEGRGVYAAVYSWIAMLASILSLSAGSTIHNKLKFKPDTYLAETYGALVFIGIIVSLIGACIIPFLYFFSDGNIFGKIAFHYVLVVLIIIPFQIFEWYTTNMLIFANDIKAYNISLILGNTLGFGIMLLLMFFDIGIYAAIIAYLFNKLSLSVYSFIRLNNKINKIILSKSRILLILKNSIRLHFGVIATTIIGQIDILMLNKHFVDTKSEVGIYEVAYKLIEIMLIVSSAGSVYFYGIMGQDTTLSKTWQIQKKSILKIFVLMSIIAIIAYFVSPYFIPLILGCEFNRTVGVFNILLLSLPGMVLGTLISNQLIGRGFFIVTSVVAITMCLINILFNYILIPEYGMYGTAYATIATYTFSFLFSIGFIFYISKL